MIRRIVNLVFEEREVGGWVSFDVDLREDETAT